MNILSSICSMDPFIKREGHTRILYSPYAYTFQHGDPFEFEFMVDDIFASWQRYTIHKDHLSISLLRYEPRLHREFLLHEAPHREGLPTLSVVADATVLATMKRLGLFELAESILDAQSSAFPDFLS